MEVMCPVTMRLTDRTVVRAAARTRLIRSGICVGRVDTSKGSPSSACDLPRCTISSSHAGTSAISTWSGERNVCHLYGLPEACRDGGAMM